uniref:Uncharacterized protein n=1 Tax=Rhizophora mucronata TaxID=61149 RepID=A0A2P2QTK7_RHIMU
MGKHGCKLSPYVCNPLINGFIRASKLAEAVHFLKVRRDLGLMPQLMEY